MADEDKEFKFYIHGTNEERFVISKENDEEKKVFTSRDYTGRGTAYYPNGDVYEGNYKKGIRKGKGVYSYLKKNEDDEPVDPDKYEGDWLNNKKHGIGKMNYVLKKASYYG